VVTPEDIKDAFSNIANADQLVRHDGTYPVYYWWMATRWELGVVTVTNGGIDMTLDPAALNKAAEHLSEYESSRLKASWYYSSKDVILTIKSATDR
jgi:hypothetical protein